jgi:hypothetical protein
MAAAGGSTGSTWSNCFNHFAAGASTGAPAGFVAPRVVNALELSWNMPYAIPSDGTHTSLTCSPEGSKKANDWAIYPSSIVTNVGAGNCYYTNTIGVDDTSD